MAKLKKSPDNEEHSSGKHGQNSKKSAKQKTKVGRVQKKVAKQFTSYKCTVCSKKFTDKYSWKAHESIHTDETFPCPQCPYIGATKKYLARHRKNNHTAPTQYKCNVCGKMFHHKCSLKVHMMVHTGEKPHKCDVCGKAFRVMFSLHSHMLIHTNEKPYKCSFCDYACRDNSTHRKHENRHMGIVKMYPCKICSKKFPDKAKLKYHISEVHLDYLDLDLKRFPCDKCSTTFRTKFNLRKHIEAVHDKSLWCKCPVCGQKLSNKNNLSAHLRTHFDERPHACVYPGCGKKFKDKGSLKKHNIIHFPHLHQPCRICGATFSRPKRLERHILTHNPKEKSVECDYCGVTFYTKNYLIKHIRKKHTNKEKFTCDRCGLITYNKPSIVMHLKYGHQHDQDLHCKICKTVYKRHEYLKAHYLRTHNIKYKPMKRCSRKDSKPKVEVKVEPIDSEPFGEIQLLEVHKAEIIEEEDPNVENDLLPYSKHVLSEDLAECLVNGQGKPEDTFDEFLYQQVFHKTKEEEPTKEEVDEEQEASVTQKIKEIIKIANENETAKLLEKRQKKEAKMLDKKLRREAKIMRRKRRREVYELEKVRQLYNERMKAAAAAEFNKKEPAKTIKYFKQKSTANISTDKQTDETNAIINTKDNSDDLNEGCSNNNPNDGNGGEVTHSSNEVPNTVTSDDTNKSDESVNGNNNQITTSCNEKIDLPNDTINDPDTQTTELNVENKSENDDRDGHENDSQNTNKSDESIIETNNQSATRSRSNNKIDSPKDPDTQTTQLNFENKAENDDKDGHKNDSLNDNDGGSDDDTNDEDADSNYEPNPEDCSGDESTGNKRLKFKTHQCYICFKLYPNKEDLISHCESHFPVCNSRTLAKCPVCGHVTHAHIARHMFAKHGVRVNIPYTKITDRKDNSSGSRYCYKMDNAVVEIIPSVKILNHSASIEIDARNRRQKDKTIAKTRLVKKGKEWIVENVAVNISFEELPEFDEQDLRKLAVTGNYVDRLGQISRLAKKRGIKMMFPCNLCDKICRNFCALKLHGRRHDPNKKPFAPRKHKRNEKPVVEKKKLEVTNFENRLAKPKPIKNRHKCDEKLKKFYETHIRGADIEFWQFLKIFNKMDRENIQDFKDFEGRPEFGIHTNEDRAFNDPKSIEPLPTKTVTHTNNTSSTVDSSRTISVESSSNDNQNAKLGLPKTLSLSSSKLNQQRDITKKPLFKRVIMISKKQFKEREKAKNKLREEIQKGTDSLKLTSVQQ